MNTKQLLVSAAVAGILSASPMALANDHDHGKADGHCTQANKCKGHGACHSVKEGGNDCAGHNSCKNHVFKSDEAACKKAKGKWAKG